MVYRDDNLEPLLAHIKDQRTRDREDYYQGHHPKVYVTPKLEQTFRDLTDSMIENYCALAISTRLDRLQVLEWMNQPTQDVWTQSDMPRHQDRLHRWALVHGHAWLLLDSEEQTMTPNPATLVAALPDPDDPDIWMVGAKLWRVGDETRVTLWYPDRTIRLAGTDDRLHEIDTVTQPMGAVPLVRVEPYGDGPRLLDQIAPVQDRINKLTANGMVAAEFGAFAQRIFFTRQDVDPYDLRNAPDHAIVLDPGDTDAQTRVQETTATELSNYDNTKNEAINALFTIASLPRHLRVNPGSPPSGDAIKADEGPLVEAVLEHQRELGEGYRKALELLDIDTPGRPQWRDPEVNHDLTNAQTIQALVNAGVPWQIAVKKHGGWTDGDVAEAEALLATPTTQGDAAGAALLSAFAPTAAAGPLPPLA